LHPFDFSSRPRAHRSYGRRFCDRLTRSKQTAATAAAIFGLRFSAAQCLRGVRGQTWRDVAHGPRPRWAVGERHEAADGAAAGGLKLAAERGGGRDPGRAELVGDRRGRFGGVTIWAGSGKLPKGWRRAARSWRIRSSCFLSEYRSGMLERGFTENVGGASPNWRGAGRETAENELLLRREGPKTGRNRRNPGGVTVLAELGELLSKNCSKDSGSLLTTSKETSTHHPFREVWVPPGGWHRVCVHARPRQGVLGDQDSAEGCHEVWWGFW
jgi:hypothetical protein